MRLEEVLRSRWLKALLWSALIAQGLVAVWISRPWLTADSIEYLKLADALAQGSYGSMTAEGFRPDVLRPPGYPLILCLLKNILGLPLWAISLVQVGAWWLSVLLVQRMLRRFGVEPAPMLALAAVYPFPAMYSANMMTESWSALALTGIAALLAATDRTWRTYAFAGLVAGLAILLRADLLLLPALIAALAVVLDRKASPLATRAARAAVSLAAAGLVLLPYMVWNYSHFGKAKPVPLAGALGNVLYIATWQPALPFEDLNAVYAGVFTPRAKAAGLAEEVRSINKAIGAPIATAPWNPAAYPTNDLKIRSTEKTLEVAMQRIRRDPWTYAEHVVGNAWRLGNTSRYPGNVPASAVLLLALFSGLIWIAAAGGILMSAIRPSGWPIPFWVAIPPLYVMGIHVFLHTEARYSAPVRPLVLLLATGFCCWIAGVLVRRFRAVRDQSQ